MFHLSATRPAPAFRGDWRPPGARGAGGRRGRSCLLHRVGSSSDRVPRPRPSATPPGAHRSGGLPTDRPEVHTCRGRRAEPLREAPSNGLTASPSPREITRIEFCGGRRSQTGPKSDAYSGEGHILSSFLTWRRPAARASSAMRTGFNL